MDNQKKISAAIAAVMHYIQEEEAILTQQAPDPGHARIGRRGSGVCAPCAARQRDLARD